MSSSTKTLSKSKYMFIGIMILSVLAVMILFVFSIYKTRQVNKDFIGEFDEFMVKMKNITSVKDSLLYKCLKSKTIYMENTMDGDNLRVRMIDITCEKNETILSKKPESIEGDFFKDLFIPEEDKDGFNTLSIGDLKNIKKYWNTERKWISVFANMLLPLNIIKEFEDLFKVVLQSIKDLTNPEKAIESICFKIYSSELYIYYQLINNKRESETKHKKIPHDELTKKLNSEDDKRKIIGKHDISDILLMIFYPICFKEQPTVVTAAADPALNAI